MTFSCPLLQLLMILFSQAAFRVQICRCQAVKKTKLSWHWKFKELQACLQPAFLSKITEKIALLQLSQHLENNTLFYFLQSAYRPGHVTEIALVNDLLAAQLLSSWCQPHFSALSAWSIYRFFTLLITPFYSPDSVILLAFLALFCLGFSHTSLIELRSYLSDRTQWCFLYSCGLKLWCSPGSVLGPIFALYTYSISEILSYHSLSHHSFSDDSQLYKSGNVSQLPEIIHSARPCISDVKSWMANNQL